MREKIWLALRESDSVRRLQSVPGLCRIMKNLSYVLLPSYSQRTVELQSGLGQGLLMTLNPRWETALWQGNYEVTVQATLESLLGPGKVFYDVGGGIGFYSLLAVRLGACSLAFDPDRFNASCIRHNAEINGFSSQISVFDMAVYSHTGEVKVESALQNRGHGNAHVIADEARLAGLEVTPCTRLDDFIQKNRVPDLVKIDVEGAETEVLKGGRNLFCDARPHLICEIHDASNAGSVVKFLQDVGYAHRWLGSSDLFPVQLVGTPKPENRLLIATRNSSPSFAP